MAEGDCSLELAIAFGLKRLGLTGVSLKPKQKLAVQAIYEGKDAFLCLPTGYGKSLCYQVLPFVMDFKFGHQGKCYLKLYGPSCYPRFRNY